MKWVKVYSAIGIQEANIIKGLLEANGIRCYVKENAASTMNYPLAESQVDIPIFTLDKDEFTAKELLRKEVIIETEET